MFLTCFAFFFFLVCVSLCEAVASRRLSAKSVARAHNSVGTEGLKGVLSPPHILKLLVLPPSIEKFLHPRFFKNIRCPC